MNHVVLPSLDLLTRRISAIPSALRSVLASDQRGELPRIEPRVGRRIVVTGIGLSEGPARFTVSLLARNGQRAQFVPLSQFVDARVDFGIEPPPGSVGSRGPSPWELGDTLVIFSQGLCPNARLALAAASRFSETWLFTALEPSADAPAGSSENLLARCVRSDGVRLVRHPPTSESGMLLRVVGPAAATCAAILWSGCEEAEALARAPERVAKATCPPAACAQARELRRPGSVAFVTAGGYDAFCSGLAWKYQEALWSTAPPVWDVLQITHGPFQGFYRGPLTLFGLIHEGRPGEAALLDRLESMLVPGRQRLVRLTASLPAPLGWFEHDAMINQVVLSALATGPREDLSEWPGKGEDRPLYELGRRDDA